MVLGAIRGEREIILCIHRLSLLPLLAVPWFVAGLAGEDVPKETEGIVQRFVVNVPVQISDLIWLSLCQTQKRSVLCWRHIATHVFSVFPKNGVRVHEKLSLFMGQLRLSLEVNKT